MENTTNSAKRPIPGVWSQTIRDVVEEMPGDFVTKSVVDELKRRYPNNARVFKPDFSNFVSVVLRRMIKKGIIVRLTPRPAKSRKDAHVYSKV